MVDPEAGKIWLNAPNCVLRIQGIKFRNSREKFSMIDINGDDASMLEGDLATTDVHDFIEKVSSIVINNNFSQEDLDKTLSLVNAVAICKGDNKE